MKKPLKLVLSGVSLMLGVCFFAGLLLSGYLHTDQARTHLLNVVNQRIAGKLSIQSHRISLLKGEIEIWNARISDSVENELISFDNLLIDFSWIGLLSGNLIFQQITLKHPDIKLAVLPEGALNLFSLYPTHHSDQTSDSSTFFSSIVFKTIKIIDASSSYEDSQENISICLENMDADISADLLKQAASTHIRIGNGHISTQSIHTAFGPVSIQGGLTDGDFLPVQLSLLSPALNADISGSISNIRHDPELCLSLTLSSDLAALQHSLNMETSLSGRIQVAGNLSGPLLNPNVDLKLTSEQAKIADYSLDHLRMTASITDRIIVWDSLYEPTGKGSIHISGDADLKQAFASGLFAPAVDLSTLSAQMQVAFDAVNLKALLPSATGVVSGTLAVQCKGYPDYEPKADIGIDLQAAQISLYPDTEPMTIRVNSQSRWNSGKLQIHQFLAQTGSTRLKASGIWDASDNHITGDLACQTESLSKSLSPLGIRGASGSLDMSAGLSGTLERPEFSLKLKSSQLGFGDIQLGSLNVDADIGPSGILHISSLSLKNRGAELTGKGEIPVYTDGISDSRRAVAFAAAFRRIQPSDFFKSSGIQGFIDGGCKLEGTEKSLSGSLQIQATGMKVQTVRLGNITGEFRLAEGKIQSQRLFLENRQSHADFSGAVQIFEPGSLSFHRSMPFRFSGSGTALSAEDFVDFLKGKLSIATEMEGFRGQITGSAKIQSGQLVTGSKNFKQQLTAVDLAADFKNNKLNISRADVFFSPDESLKASGWVAPDRSFHAELAANGISFGHINALADNFPSGEGKLFLNLVGNGQLDHPRVQGEIRLNPFRLYESNWDHTRIELQLADDLARFQLDSQIQGYFSFRLPTQDYTAELDFSRINLLPFFRAAGLEKVGGAVSGQISASGNFNSLKTLNASAGLSELSLNATGHPLIEGRDLRIGIQNEAVVIPRNRLILFKDGTLDIGGEARIGQDISLRLNADIPVSAAKHFNEKLSDLRGNLTISAMMKGSWYSPDTEAFVDIRNAGLTLDNIAQDIHDVNGRIHITPKMIAIDDLEGRVDNGRISLKGRAEIDAFRIQAMDFKMGASQVPIKSQDTLDAKLNADLSLHGTAHASSLQGEIIVLEGLYYKNVNLNPIRSLIQRERGYQAHSEITFPAAIQNMLLDIRIPPRKLFVVDNNLAQLNLSPDMLITGTLQRPVIQGRTRVDSGSLQYQSTTFTIKKGFIDFINPYTMESVLDIQSQAAIQNWTVFLDISGPLDKLNLKLSSSPFLDDNDLLSLLITGKTTRAAISKTTDSSSSSQKMLADLLSASIGSDLKKASGLDILEVDSTGKSRHVNDEPLKVTFGKIISPRITLKYSVESKAGVTFQRTITEYMFIENILLSGFQDSRGVFGGEVKFRHEFR
jgi:autotransporter translocation and assembly factor TamB